MIFCSSRFLLSIALCSLVTLSIDTSSVCADMLRASSSRNTQQERQHGHQQQAAEEQPDDRNLAKVARSLGFDADMSEYMRGALVTKISTQRMVGGTLAINGEVISFDDKHLESIRVTSDGSNANVYKVKMSGRDGRDDSHSTVRVLKSPEGKVEYVSVRIRATGERIGGETFGNSGDLYAVYSTNNLDKEAMKRLKLESLRGPNDNANDRANDNPNNRDNENRNRNRNNRNNKNRDNGGRALQTGTCSSYKVIRMNARFDAGFCASYGGVEQNAINRINFIVSEFNDSYMEYPLCTKVETCGVSGSCNAANDDFVSVIGSANGFCGGSGTLISNFREYLYPAGTSHSTLYSNGECDTTMLFFGNDVNGNDWFPATNTVGCAYTGAICGTYSVGVNQVGQFSNVAAQSVLVAHELAHQLDAAHDTFEGFVMAPSFCSTCSNIPESFSSVSVSAMNSYIAIKEPSSTCVGYEAVGSTSSPTPSPTPAPVQATPSPTPAPIDNTSLCNGYTSFGSCYYGGCVWNGVCLSESQTSCEELTNVYYCLYNGLGCAWDLNRNKCITYFVIFRKERKELDTK